MPATQSPRSAINFQEVCLHCGHPKQQENYVCSECNKSWQYEYRSMDLKMVYNSRSKKLLRESINTFDLTNPQGILQYAGLPHHHSKDLPQFKVGLTPLLKLESFSKSYGCRVYAKAEGLNPSGCFKDRETLMCLLNSRNRKFNKAVIYSSGNAAASASIFAQKTDFGLVTFVAGDTYEEKIEYIRQHGSDVIVIGDEKTNFEQGYRIYAGINSMGLFNEQGYDDWSVRNPYRAQGDKTTAIEIVKQLGHVPNYVVVPTANGTCLAGMWKGFKELKELGVIDTLPKMVSTGIRNASPIYKAVQRQQTDRPVRCDLSKLHPEDAGLGSIILAEEGYDSLEATKAVLESEGTAVEVGYEEMVATLRNFLKDEETLASKYNLVPEPASLISIAAIAKIKQEHSISPDQTVVSVITGSGVKAREQIIDLLVKQELKDEVNELLDHRLETQFPKAKKKGRVFRVDEDFESVVTAFYNLDKENSE